MQKVTSKIENCVVGRVTPGRSAVLIWAFIGLDIHPAFQRFATLLRVWIWQVFRHLKGAAAPYLSPSALQPFAKLTCTPHHDGKIDTSLGQLKCNHRFS